MNTSQRTSNSDMILQSSEFSLGHTDSPETTSDVVAVLILCSVHFVLRSPEDYIPLSTSILLRNSLRNYRTFDLHPFLPSYSFEDPFYSTVVSVESSGPPTPLITVVSIDPLDHSGESPEYRLR
ncbi:hypothetical protein EV363DRAFT_1404886 [Boletus edulis]|nr:hypothetical protein EV363DRAFT_1404886 [Boletus edulis]